MNLIILLLGETLDYVVLDILYDKTDKTIVAEITLVCVWEKKKEGESLSEYVHSTLSWATNAGISWHFCQQIIRWQYAFIVDWNENIFEK